jgi:hypothetical protein
MAIYGRHSLSVGTSLDCLGSHPTDNRGFDTCPTDPTADGNVGTVWQFNDFVENATSSDDQSDSALGVNTVTDARDRRGCVFSRKIDTKNTRIQVASSQRNTLRANITGQTGLKKATIAINGTAQT